MSAAYSGRVANINADEGKNFQIVLARQHLCHGQLGSL